MGNVRNVLITFIVYVITFYVFTLIGKKFKLAEYIRSKFKVTTRRKQTVVGVFLAGIFYLLFTIICLVLNLKGLYKEISSYISVGISAGIGVYFVVEASKLPVQKPVIVEKKTKRKKH